jgi:hypothetical protein
MSACPLSDQRFVYKATFEITHGLDGRQMRAPVKVTCPSLRTARDKRDVGDGARNSLAIIAFNMYVRVVSRMRQNMLMDEMEIDADLKKDAGHPIVDPQLPEKVVEAFFPMETVVCGVVRQLCSLNSIHYVDPDILFNEGSRSSVESEE